MMTNDHFYFSLLRWRTDPTRDEARNVAVIVVGENGEAGGLQSAPISAISPTLHEQGLLDEVVLSLERRFAGNKKMRLDELLAIREGLNRSLYLTEPRAVAVSDLDLTLHALYRAYAAPRPVSSRGVSKGQFLDRVVVSLRGRGMQVQRGRRLNDVLFDLVVDGPDEAVGSVLSFASGAADFANVERDAGHFLYGLARTSRPGLAYIQPPEEAARDAARDAHQRILGWYGESAVDVRLPDDLSRPRQQSLALPA